jgi:DNA-binding MarR family transcriptional regulator
MSPIHIDAGEAFYLALSRAHDAWDTMVRGVLKDASLSPSEYELLRIAENTPGVTAAEAKKRLRITGPSTSALVSALERKQLIIRERNTDDARILHISLTPKGADTIQKSKAAFEKILGDASLSLDSLSSAASSLTTLTSSLLLHVS